MPKPWQNSEGYNDPTAFEGMELAIQEENREKKRVEVLISVLKNIISLAGYELIARIEIRDRKTGREYK